MFDIFFGWRKASKCKNLIKRVQCRLKLLKNKRSCIIRQLRDDLSELLRNGHYEIVIDRVEQLYMDEKMVALYDLLESYCEFIIINLPYIRRHKDSPNDINEAMSSIIFASARLGDLPELVLIRKLFGERYGQKFETSALKLLPGNLVNDQIKEHLCISSVSDEEKYRLVDEIARSCFQQGPLLLEYRREEDLVNETSNATADYKEDGDMRLKDSNITETEAKIVSVDHSSKDPATFTYFSTTNTSKDSMCCLKSNDNARNLEFAQPSYLSQSPISSPERVIGRNLGKASDFTFEQNIDRGAAESSSESSAELPEQMIYLDDIQEFASSVSKDVSFQDQRLFMFKAPFVPLRVKIESQNAKERARSLRKNRKISGKRLRRRSLSMENSFVSDTDSVIYYGEYRESSPDNKRKRQNRRRNSRKSSVEESQKSYYTLAPDSKAQPCFVKFRSSLTFVKCIDDCSRSTCNRPIENSCCLEHPCHYWIADEKDNRQTPFRKRRSRAAKDFSKHSLKERDKGLCERQCSCSQGQHIAKTYQDVERKTDHFVKPDTEEIWESQETCSSIMSSTSRMMDPMERKENQVPYLRAMTMPSERPKDSLTDNFLRSSSFPIQEPGNALSENRHVHPKLPDYDELAAKFMALKNEKLQKQC